MIDHVLTTCPYCGCGCNLYLQVVDGHLVGAIPSKTHAISKGALCIKGWNSWAFVEHQDRLKKPQIMENGKLVETSWEHALDVVAKKLVEIRDKYGPDSIALLSSAKCTNEENFLMMKLARAVIGTNNIDHCARLCHASTVAGLGISFGSGAMTNSVPEFEESDCILITGSNTIEQHPLIGSRIIQAREKGAKMIFIDPRKTPMALHADIFLQPKPGTDVAWINGFMNVILREGLQDKEFIESRTENFEAVMQIVEKYDPETVEKITGIPKEKLIEAAITFAEAEKGSIVYSMGITQHTTGTDNVKSLANLAMLTGNIGRRATGVNPLRGQNNVQGGCDMGALPNVFSGYQRVDDETVSKKFQAAWGKELPKTPGLTVVEMMNAVLDGRIKAMYIMGENPMVSDPDILHVKAALENLEFLVVQDIFPTETSRFAHVVLPGASFAEKDGTFTGTDRRVQRVRKAIDPVGESKPDWEILSMLAKKMGSNSFNYGGPDDVMKEIASLTPIYGGVTFDRLENEEIMWPCRDANDKGTAILHEKSFTRGKGLFSPIEYREPAELTDEHYPLVLTTGRVLFQYHTRTMTGRSPKLDSEVPESFIEICPADAEQRGICDGETISVSSRRGSVKVKAWVTENIRNGVVFMPFHYAEGAANMLTIAALDPVAKIPEFKVCAVQVAKATS